MNIRLKVPRNSLLLAFVFFVIFEPDMLADIRPVHYVFIAMKILLFVLYFTRVQYRFFSLKERPMLFLTVILTIFMLVSIASGHPSMDKLLDYFDTLLFCMVISEESRKNYRLVLQTLATLMSIYVLMNFLTIVVFPHGIYQKMSAWENTRYYWILGYKNPVARFVLGAIGIVSYSSEVLHNKIEKKQVLLIIIGFLTAILVDSATGCVAFAVFIVLFFCVQKGKFPSFVSISRVYFFSAIGSYLVVFVGVQSWFSTIIVNVLHRNVTLTSRVYIWNRAINSIMGNLLIGRGLETVAKTAEILKAAHAHNYFLHLLYSGGLVTVFFLICFICSISNRVKAHKSRESLICIITFVSLMVVGFTESLIGCASLLYGIIILEYYRVTRSKLN